MEAAPPGPRRHRSTGCAFAHCRLCARLVRVTDDGLTSLAGVVPVHVLLAGAMVRELLCDFLSDRSLLMHRNAADCGVWTVS